MKGILSVPFFSIAEDGTDAITIALLPYLVPTTSKKQIPDYHRYLIDNYPVGLRALE